MIQFNSENEFRDWLLNEVRKRIRGESLNFQVLESKNVSDIVIFKESESLPAIVLIEVKFYRSSNNRINIGTSTGEGFQPEILSKQPIYCDRYLRWVMCNENGKCVLANNEAVRSKYLSGGKITKGQQNNIRTNIFDKEETVDISEIANKIIDWLKTV
jgi:hypothetical protein